MAGYPESFFRIFEKTVHSKVLTLFIAVLSSSANILICQLYAHHFLRCRKFHILEALGLILQEFPLIDFVNFLDLLRK